MSGAEKTDIEDITRRLDVIIFLLLAEREDITIRQMISTLSDRGLEVSEISRILNRKSKYISKELSLLKKSKGKE